MKFPPILSSVMKNRQIALIIIVLPVIFILLNITELFEWKCPFFTLTGIQCPGCGMSRGMIAAVKGDLISAIHFHPFSFLLIAGWIILIIIFFIPEIKRTQIIDRIQVIESKTGFVIILTALFICFGLVRIVFQIYDKLGK